MKTIQENISEVKRLEALIESHCMAAQFIKEKGCYLVYYPEGMFPNGAQARYNIGGKAVALTRLLEVIERHWIENGII